MPVAVIDIGSNSIKTLVAERAENGGIDPLYTMSLDARLGTGITQNPPRLSEQGMMLAESAIVDLLKQVAPYDPFIIQLVATSAVRDAANQSEFIERIFKATGYTIRILSGTEEANLIGRGLTMDPQLRDLKNFNVFDLGGGSLETLHFNDRHISIAQSLPLGCVRLTEKFIPDRDAPIPQSQLDAIALHVRESYLRNPTLLSALRGTSANIFTGGTAITSAFVLKLEKENVIPQSHLAPLLQKLASLNLEQRRKIPGLPPARADVYPAALATILALSEMLSISTLHISHYNLRYGLADRLLSP